MKISAVIPVYNAEKYIYRCINSVISQTYTNWEIVFVDDGSTDKSVEIITQFASTEKRIKLYHQSNKGPGSARNLGIKHVQGEIVVFIDSDDYIDRDYFLQLSKAMTRYDLVFINVAQVSSSGSIIKNENMYQYKKLDKDTLLRQQMTGRIPWGGVRKAVRMQLITKNNILFSNLLVGEECLYSFKVLKSAQTYGFLSAKIDYFYVNHKSSQSKLIEIDPYYNVVVTMKTYLHENGCYEEYADTLNSLIIVAMLVSIDRITNMFTGNLRNEKCHQVVNQYSKIIDRQFGIDIHNMPMKALVCVPFIDLKNYQTIFLLSIIKSFVKRIKIGK